MNKLILLFLFLVLPLSKLKGQTIFPSWADNPSWNVLECFWYNCSTVTYQYVYDTTFCNQTYSKMVFPFNQNGYFRSNTIQTKFRKTTNCNDKEYLLYDYSLNIGDTTYVGYDFELGYPKDTAAFVLNQIDTVNYLGVDRVRFKMNYDRCDMGFPFDYMYWIQGIGAEIHPFYSFRCLCDICESGYNLLCYDSITTQLYQNTIFNTCDTTITVGLNQIEQSSNLSIDPNPFQTVAQLKCTGFEVLNLKIFNSSGQLIKKISGVSGLIIGDDLISGIYFIEIQTGNIRKTMKINKL